MTLHLDDLTSITTKFAPANMDLLAKRELQKRVDQKYILPISKIYSLLDILRNDFAIIPIASHNVAEYQTQYFDTKEYFFFINHLRGKRPRYKVRLRRYIDRNICMLECKKKKADLTVKTSIEVPYDTSTLLNHHSFFDELPYKVEYLYPSLLNTFHRITLLHKNLEERLTIDFNIAFDTPHQNISVDNCIIIERKKLPVSTVSSVPYLLRCVRAYPLSISKYCIGGYHLFNTNKNTLYRAKSHLLRKLTHDRTL